MDKDLSDSIKRVERAAGFLGGWGVTVFLLSLLGSFIGLIFLAENYLLSDWWLAVVLSQFLVALGFFGLAWAGSAYLLMRAAQAKRPAQQSMSPGVGGGTARREEQLPEDPADVSEQEPTTKKDSTERPAPNDAYKRLYGISDD